MSVTILRFTKPNLERTFKVPFGKILPVLAGLSLMFLMGGIEHAGATIATGAMFAFLGVPLYIMKSVENKPLIVERMLNYSSFLRKLTYNIFVKPRTHKHMIAFWRF